MDKTKINKLIAKSVKEMEAIYESKLTKREIEIFTLGMVVGTKIISGSCTALIAELEQFDDFDFSE